MLADQLVCNPWACYMVLCHNCRYWFLWLVSCPNKGKQSKISNCCISVSFWNVTMAVLCLATSRFCDSSIAGLTPYLPDRLTEWSMCIPRVLFTEMSSLTTSSWALAGGPIRYCFPASVCWIRQANNSGEGSTFAWKVRALSNEIPELS
jgi:hypothetical protein